MNERIEYVKNEMQKLAVVARESFGALSADRLNWKPRADGWSVGQCLEHLILTNEKFYPEMDKLAAGTRKNSFFENWSPFSGFFGRFLIKAVSEDSKKAKAPSKDIVPPSDVPSDIVDRFSQHVADLNTKIDACAAAELKKTVVTSPFLAIITYSLDDAYTVLVEHTKRHIRQAKRVMDSEGFPN